MIDDIRQRGFKDGYKAAKIAKDSGMPPKTICNRLFADDREVAKQLMNELKDHNVRWDKCFHLAVKYSFGFDNGVALAAYEST